MLARSLRARTGCVVFAALFVLGVAVVVLSHWQQTQRTGSTASDHNPIVIPPVGSHVSITGAYVLDLDHGWTEIQHLQEVHVL